MRIKLLTLISILFCCNHNAYNQDLQQAIQRASFFLKSTQLPTGEFQDSTNVLFNSWETILVTDALLDNHTISDTSIQRAHTWLSLHENADRLICHNAKCRKDYCIETSALYLRLLARMDDTLNLENRLKFIDQLQEMDGSWKVGNPAVLDQVNFPSVTAFVMNLFDTVNHPNKNKEKSISFIMDHQLTDGSWGQTWEYYNTPAYALWQILPSIKNVHTCQEAFQKGKNFIYNSQLENGSWNYKDEAIKNKVSAELQTALMLSCLLDEKDNKSLKSIEKGIEFLLAKQHENGSWEGGFFPIPNERYKKREYLFATALTYKVLIKYEHTLSDE